MVEDWVTKNFFGSCVGNNFIYASCAFLLHALDLYLQEEEEAGKKGRQSLVLCLILNDQA